jgi:hypothetical protein
MCISCVIKRYIHDRELHEMCKTSSVQEINDKIFKDISEEIIPDYLCGFIGACLGGNLGVAQLLLPHLPKYSEYSEQYHLTDSLDETAHSENMEYLGLYVASIYANFSIIEYILSQRTFTQRELDRTITYIFYHIYVRQSSYTARYNCLQILLQHGAKLENDYCIAHAIHIYENEKIADIIWLFAKYDCQDYIFHETKTLEEKEELKELEEYFVYILDEEKKIRETLHANFPPDLDNLICDFLFTTTDEKRVLFCAKHLPMKIGLSLLFFLHKV